MPDKPRSKRSHPVPLTASQVGRRPPRPVIPVITGLMWIAVGIVALATFTSSWKVIVGVVAIGIGALFLRGGIVAFARQGARRSSE